MVIVNVRSSSSIQMKAKFGKGKLSCVVIIRVKKKTSA
jgi:hypothetical protein